MKKFVRASLLILAVSYTAYAGEMPTPRSAEPQPTPTLAQVSTQESTISNTQDESAVASTLTEAVLDLITDVLALF